MPRKSKLLPKSSSSSSSMLNTGIAPINSDREMGKALARVFLDELHPSHFPEPRKSDKEKWIGELYGVVRVEKDKNEERSEKGNKKAQETSDFQFRAEGKRDPLPKRGGVIDFQTIQKKALPKFVFAPDISADTSLSELFCIGYGGFMPEGSISIEHAYPHDKIRNNQARLLDYLNKPENRRVTESFLNYEGIADYVRRDVNDSDKVKGSLYFFKHSYGAMTNLFLLSQAENSSKSTKDLLDWVENENSPFLGAAFIQHININGGCHEGILFDRVYHFSKDEENCRHIQLAEDANIILPPTDLEVKGLGQMIREWIAKLDWAINLHRENHTDLVIQFRRHVDTLIAYFVDDSVSEQERVNLIRTEQQKLEKRMKELAEIQQSILDESVSRSAQVLGLSAAERSSPSSPGSSDVGGLSKMRTIEGYVNTQKINHYLHRMRTAIKIRYGVDLAREIYAYVNELPDLDKLDSADWQIIARDFSAYLDTLNQQNASSSSSNSKRKEEIQESSNLSLVEEQIKVKIKSLYKAATEKIGQRLMEEKMRGWEQEREHRRQREEQLRQRRDTLLTELAAVEEEIDFFTDIMMSSEQAPTLEQKTNLQGFRTKRRELQEKIKQLDLLPLTPEREQSQSSGEDLLSPLSGDLPLLPLSSSPFSFLGKSDTSTGEKSDRKREREEGASNMSIGDTTLSKKAKIETDCDQADENHSNQQDDSLGSRHSPS